MSTVVSARASDRVPLVGTGLSAGLNGPSVVSGGIGQIVPIDTALVTCSMLVTFSDVDGGETPGTNYDSALSSGGLTFSERFAGQSVSFNGDFDVISGLPSNPLQTQVGEAGQNLDVFDYAGNALAGLGPIGYPDIDAIGEGSIAILFPVVQSQVRLTLVGGNGGSATLRFYRRDGSLIDEVVVSALGDLSYGFGTFDNSNIIAGILIQNSDESGIGVDNICYDAAPTSVRPVTWGILKQRYR
jgi:hypothetical protein